MDPTISATGASSASAAPQGGQNTSDDGTEFSKILEQAAIAAAQVAFEDLKELANEEV